MLAPRRCCGPLGDEATPEGGEVETALADPPRELKSSTIEARRRLEGRGDSGCSDMVSAVRGMVWLGVRPSNAWLYRIEGDVELSALWVCYCGLAGDLIDKAQRGHVIVVR